MAVEKKIEKNCWFSDLFLLNENTVHLQQLIGI